MKNYWLKVEKSASRVMRIARPIKSPQLNDAKYGIDYGKPLRCGSLFFSALNSGA
jgi:hypothetical protein